MTDSVLTKKWLKCIYNLQSNAILAGGGFINDSIYCMPINATDTGGAFNFSPSLGGLDVVFFNFDTGIPRIKWIIF